MKAKWIVRVACWVCLAGAGVGLCSCGRGPVATVNGQKVSAREFYTFAGKGRGGANALMGMVFERMILQAGQKAGMTVSEKEIDEAIEEDRESLKEEAGTPSLEELVRAQFLTWEDYRWQKRLSLLVEKLCTKDVQVTEEKVNNYFEQNRGRRYDKPERADLHVMVLPSEKKAQEVRNKLVQGEPFETLAQTESLLWGRQGGAVGLVERGSSEVPEAVFDAAWKLNVGEVTAPVKVEDKCYLARLDAKSSAEKADYEKIKEQVRRDFVRENGTPPELFVAELRQDAKVDVLWDEFADLEKQFAPSPAPLGMPVPPVGKGEKAAPQAPAAGKSPATRGNRPPTGR